MAKILITGIAGSLARLTADALLEQGHDIVGVDYRRKPMGLRRKIKFHRANYNKRIIEDIFRQHEPQWVLHLGRVGNLKTGKNKRFDLNVIGSAKIMDLCVKHEVERLVVMSTYHIYGAHPSNHVPIFENEPLRAAQIFPQLTDAAQLDSQACTWVYQHRKLKTAVLRPCTIVGPNIKNAFSTYLREGTLIYLLGFSPMWQFIHERDMVEALKIAINCKKWGVFNVAGAGEVPYIEALEYTGRWALPIPASVASFLLDATGSRSVPRYFLDFFKYPCQISDEKFRREFDFEPVMGPKETIESTVYDA